MRIPLEIDNIDRPISGNSPLWYCLQELQGIHGSIDPGPPRILRLGQQAQGSFWPSSEILSEKFVNISRQFMDHALVKNYDTVSTVGGISFSSILVFIAGKLLENF